jgi:hypothetical protein
MGKFAAYRFGRPDLIGKGDSRHFFNVDPDAQSDDRWIARLPDLLLSFLCQRRR